MTRDAVTSDQLPPSGLPFSVAVRGGGLLFLSGQVAQDPATGELIDGDIAQQADQILRNIAATQAATGKDLPANVLETLALRNSSLQGAYLILAARSLGLDCGPMSGFDNAKVDAAFFGGTSVKSNFICALGVGTTELLYPRSPRLSFDEACKII